MKTNEKIRQPQQSRSKSTKEKIIHSGIELFSEKGYHNTNSKEITKHAGVGVGSFYDYFTDKKHLLMTILERHRSEVTDSLGKIQADLAYYSGKKLSKDDKHFIITGFIDFVMEFHENGSKFHSHIPKLRHLDSDIEEIIDKWDENQIKLVCGILKKPELEIKLDDYETASLIIHRTIEDTAHYIMELDDTNKIMRIKKELINMLANYLFK